MLQEFRKFALRGNVVDMAVGIILGAAFGKIVAALVNGVVMPPLGLLVGGVDFNDLKLVLKAGHPAVTEGGKVVTPAVQEVALQYGAFLSTVLDFAIVAFAIFLMVRAMNRLKRAEPTPEPTEKTCGFCCSTIPLAAVRCPHCTSELGSPA